MGQVISNPTPRVNRATIPVIISMMMPPEIVEYNMPRGPKKKARMRAIPTLLFDLMIMYWGC